MKTYIGVKLVQAEPETKNGEDGYKVVYPAEFGKPEYVSWCPKNVFEAHNFETEGGLPFGVALKAMRNGKKIARKGWNGKGMYIYLQPGSVINGKKDGRNPVLREMDDVTINPHIDMKAVDGSIVIGWLASQTDMLMDDWYIVE
jgi:hypothetical protein